MAQYPCSFCGRRYPGPQQTAYPAVVDGTSRFSERMRLCSGDFQQLISLPWLSLVESGDLDDSHGCTRCGRDTSRWAVFVPFYQHGEERHDLYGRLCGGTCLMEALRDLFGPSHEVQAASELMLGS